MRLADRIALSNAALMLGHLRISWRERAAGRRPRPWLAMVAVPLAMNASGLMDAWWTWPALIVCAWWWSERTYRWAWVVAIEAGALGTGWAYAGAYNLGQSPQHRVLVAAVWLGYALVLAAASIFTRRHRAHVADYRGY